MAKGIGRRKGSRNKGFFYRSGRGWFTKDAGKFVPLTDEPGERLREEDISPKIIQNAYARHLLAVPASEVPLEN
jgi:hypothetical protein